MKLAEAILIGALASATTYALMQPGVAEACVVTASELLKVASEDAKGKEIRRAMDKTGIDIIG